MNRSDPKAIIVFKNYFGSADLKGLPGYLEGRSLSRCGSPIPDHDTGHAWRFRLGSDYVLVIGWPRLEPSRCELAWARRVLEDYSNTPAIMLRHFFRLFDPRPPRKGSFLELISNDLRDGDPKSVWRQVFMVSQGHRHGMRARIETLGAFRILQTDSFSGGDPSGWIYLVRFYFDPNGFDEVEVQKPPILPQNPGH